jgi:hypothetical protein
MTAREPGRFVALPVSTDGQGRSGLGLEAQRQAVAAHVAQAGGEVVAEFKEVESGKCESARDWGSDSISVQFVH